MDPETAKLIVPAASALLGTLLGALVSYVIARTNLQGQRQVARDNALREYRTKQVQPLRDRLGDHLVLWNQLVMEKNNTFEIMVNTKNELENIAAELRQPCWTIVTELRTLTVKHGVLTEDVRERVGEFSRTQWRAWQQLSELPATDNSGPHSMNPVWARVWVQPIT